MDTIQNFVAWLEELSGDKAVDIARRLDVSPTLLSLVRRGDRQVSKKLADKVAAVYGIEVNLIYERAGFTFRQREDEAITSGQDEDSETGKPAAEYCLLKAQLARLRDYRAVLAYSLEGRLPAQTIEKLQKIVALEIQYGERKDSDAD